MVDSIRDRWKIDLFRFKRASKNVGLSSPRGGSDDADARPSSVINDVLTSSIPVITHQLLLMFDLLASRTSIVTTKEKGTK